MTAEVAIMNQHALVLAADSATTVTHWIGGRSEKRHFKGVNKLFQLSSFEPVGLMIFGSAAVHSVPWEILVKEFRAQLGTEVCQSVPSYVERFFEFVKTRDALFPDRVRHDVFVESAMAAAVVNARFIGDHDSVKHASGRERVEKWRARLQDITTAVTQLEIPAPLEGDDVDAGVAAHAAEVEARIRSEIANLQIPDESLVSRLAELSIRAMMQRYEAFLPSSGVVIGGYGSSDYFPSFEVYRCFGFLDRRFIAVRQSESANASRERTAVIAPFATASMINTFLGGIAPDAEENVTEATRKCLLRFAEKLKARIRFDGDIEGLQALINESVRAHEEEWLLPTFDQHHAPLARVIGAMPLPEMAALAKSLIELQSLKERVTQASESVGGAVDVAAITKHDGFVWVERKHYFRPELNPRFFIRQQQSRAH